MSIKLLSNCGRNTISVPNYKTGRFIFSGTFCSCCDCIDFGTVVGEINITILESQASALFLHLACLAKLYNIALFANSQSWSRSVSVSCWRLHWLFFFWKSADPISKISNSDEVSDEVLDQISDEIICNSWVNFLLHCFYQSSESGNGAFL